MSKSIASADSKLKLPMMVAMTDVEYNSHTEYMRSSRMGALLKSPAHFKVQMEEDAESDDSEASHYALGRSVHMGLLEKDRFKETHVVSQKFDRRTKQGKVDAEAFVLANEGKHVVDEETFATITGCIEAVMAHPIASLLLSEGRAEFAYLWEDSETGVACKIKPDFTPSAKVTKKLREFLNIPPHVKVMVDAKTTRDASPSEFSRSLYKFGYHRQAAFYMDGASEVTGSEFGVFLIVAVETKPPFAVNVFEIIPDAIEIGRAEYKKALRLFAECKALDSWPAYQPIIQPIALPKWAAGAEAFT